jgi:hypothetical protein
VARIGDPTAKRPGLSRELPPGYESAPEAVHHLGLQLAGHAVDDGSGGDRPGVREPLLERVDAEEVVTVAVGDVDVGQVLAGSSQVR